MCGAALVYSQKKITISLPALWLSLHWERAHDALTYCLRRQHTSFGTEHLCACSFKDCNSSKTENWNAAKGADLKPDRKLKEERNDDIIGSKGPQSQLFRL